LWSTFGVKTEPPRPARTSSSIASTASSIVSLSMGTPPMRTLPMPAVLAAIFASLRGSNRRRRSLRRDYERAEEPLSADPFDGLPRVLDVRLAQLYAEHDRVGRYGQGRGRGILGQGPQRDEHTLTSAELCAHVANLLFQPPQRQIAHVEYDARLPCICPSDVRQRVGDLDGGNAAGRPQHRQGSPRVRQQRQPQVLEPDVLVPGWNVRGARDEVRHEFGGHGRCSPSRTVRTQS